MQAFISAGLRHREGDHGRFGSAPAPSAVRLSRRCERRTASGILQVHAVAHLRGRAAVRCAGVRDPRVRGRYSRASRNPPGRASPRRSKARPGRPKPVSSQLRGCDSIRVRDRRDSLRKRLFRAPWSPPHGHPWTDEEYVDSWIRQLEARGPGRRRRYERGVRTLALEPDSEARVLELGIG